MQDYRKLAVWQRAHEMTLQIYRASCVFPSDERYGLTSQLRRSTASIGANLAEGCGRGTDADFARFVQVAMGSACEVDYHLLLAHDLKYLPSAEYDQLQTQLRSVRRMLVGLLKRLKESRKGTGSKPK